MTTFSSIFSQHSWSDVLKNIHSKTAQDVQRALQSERISLDDFCALISPAAAPYLEHIAQRSNTATLKRFGKTIQLFAPMYLSNECQNVCTYCGFSLGNKVPRKTLTDAEILKEVEAISAMGFTHILLVTGEDKVFAGFDYILNAVKLIRPLVSHLSIEVQPFDEEQYIKLIESGCDAVLVYQETYHREVYKSYHTKGRKSNFDYRLETPDRLGKAGVQKIGLGALLGLEDWRAEAFFLALHLDYLTKTYWQTQYSISLPRIRPAEGVDDTRFIMSDREFVQLICALRIFNEEAEITLSTREAAGFREKLIPLGITNMSAGAKTNPGGYAAGESLEQFEISDERSPAEVASLITKLGYEAVWKNWDKAILNQS